MKTLKSIVGLALLVSFSSVAFAGTLPVVTVAGGGDTGGTFGGNTFNPVSYDFNITPYLVTQDDYFAVMGSNPSGYSNADRGIHPVERVTWLQAAQYANLLSLQDGLEPVYNASWEADLGKNGWRLPTGDEFFKAAGWDPTKGGTGGYWNYGFGRDTYSGADANYYGSGDPFETTGNPRTTPVGFYDGSLYNPGGNGTIGNGNEFLTNPETNYYGLYDMSGNVRQWTNDSLSTTNNNHGVMGTQWGNGSPVANSTITGIDWSHVSDSIGFRLVNTAPIPEPSTLLTLGLVGFFVARRRR